MSRGKKNLWADITLIVGLVLSGVFILLLCLFLFGSTAFYNPVLFMGAAVLTFLSFFLFLFAGRRQVSLKRRGVLLGAVLLNTGVLCAGMVALIGALLQGTAS